MIRKILDIVENNSSFLVTSHENPDGDALGSTLALTLLLKKMGKDVVAFNKDGISPPFDFLPGSDSLVDTLPQGKKFDVGIVLDAGELRRAGEGVADACESLINIDHHPYSEEFGVVNYVDTEACATGVMIHRIAKVAGVDIDRDIAVCIYEAILADTGSFRYSNANPEAFSVAGEMIVAGVEPWEVAGALYESYDPRRMKLLGRVLSTMDIADNGQYASVYVTEEMYKETGSSAADTDGFINFPRAIRGVEVAVFIRQTAQKSFKISYRSKGAVDVGAIARELGGGGHHNAAGGTMVGHLESVLRSVAFRLESVFLLS